jgi:hypothetical protein
MLRALVCTLLIAASVGAHATPVVAIHVTCATSVSAVHARTLHAALAARRLPAGVTLDVALVRITATRAGTQIEIAAEVRGALSDASGRMRSTARVHAKARGPVRDRALLEREVIEEVAQRLALTWARPTS